MIPKSLYELPEDSRHPDLKTVKRRRKISFWVGVPLAYGMTILFALLFQSVWETIIFSIISFIGVSYSLENNVWFPWIHQHEGMCAETLHDTLFNPWN